MTKPAYERAVQHVGLVVEALQDRMQGDGGLVLDYGQARAVLALLKECVNLLELLAEYDQ